MNGVENLNFREEGYEIRVSRLIPSERREALWVVFDEDGVSFQNPFGTEPNATAPIAASLASAFPESDRNVGRNVTVGSHSIDDLEKEYLTDSRSVYVVNRYGYNAMDEDGDYGRGGSLAEAVYNTSAVIDLIERFD